MPNFDIILAGGGLANSLIAWRLAELQPQARVLLVERDSRLGGNHTWSFHHTDVSPSAREWLAPLVASSWAAQEVRFPAFTRTMLTGYNSIDSGHLHQRVAERLGDRIMFGAQIRSIEPTGIVLDGGQTLTATCVIDGRGLSGHLDLALGYQKFAGLQIETTAPHGLDRPIIMDATVPQIDGYRFVYCLPFTPTSILVEDTYYADGPDLGTGALMERIEAYIGAKGWQIARIEREESGVLPIVLAGDIDAFWKTNPSVPKVGLAAGMFHPLTGYSLPDAVRMADMIAAAPLRDSATLALIIKTHAADIWRQRGIFRLLNRLLFLAAEGPERRKVLQRFYRLPQGLIERFYAGFPTMMDKARILTGRPPVPFGRALNVVAPEAAAHRIALNPTQAAPRGNAEHL